MKPKRFKPVDKNEQANLIALVEESQGINNITFNQAVSLFAQTIYPVVLCQTVQKTSKA